MKVRSSIPAACLLAISLVSCAANAPIATLPTLEDKPSTCGDAANKSFKLLFTDLPEESRKAIEKAAQQGVVVVDYDACTLKVLSSCKAGEGYKFQGKEPEWQRLSIDDEKELSTWLLFRDTSPGNELRGETRWDLEYVVVGERVAKQPTIPQGDCENPTHYVESMLVGAYGLSVVQKEKATLENLGRGEAIQEVRRLQGAGTVEACANADAAAKACDVVLQLSLKPVKRDALKTEVTTDLGEDLGAVPDVPKVGKLRPFPKLEGKIGDVDSTLLELLKNAIRTDASNATAAEKAKAWESLATYQPKKGTNPYRQSATERKNKWEEVHEAEKLRSQYLSLICTQHKKDRAKLKQLLDMDEELVSASEKRAYKAEFEKKYQRFKKELAECKRCPDGMAWIPWSSLGDELADDDDHVIRTGRPAGFCMDTTEVTVAAYAACVRSGTCSSAHDTVYWSGIAKADEAFWSQFCNARYDDRSNHPVNCVDWNQAKTYCEQQGKRLPTEEEWEHAARSGPKERTYPWGEEVPGHTLLNACGSECVSEALRHGRLWQGMYTGSDQWIGTAPVDSFPRGRTAQGLADMAGNVMEWTSSGWQADDKESGIMSRRVVQGSAWDAGDAAMARGGFHSLERPNFRSSTVGFRCSLTP